MPAPAILGYDLDGWKEICAAIGRSENTAREWSRRERDPLPVAYFGKSVVARRAELRAWVAREMGVALPPEPAPSKTPEVPDRFGLAWRK